MPNQNYIQGRNGEYYLRNALKSAGYAAERSAASHGPWDVVGVRADHVLLIQAKTGGKPSPSEYKTIVDLPTPPGTIKMVVWIPTGQRVRQARILYCADHSGDCAAPTWCAQAGWQVGPPPRQYSLRLPS